MASHESVEIAKELWHRQREADELARKQRPTISPPEPDADGNRFDEKRPAGSSLFDMSAFGAESAGGSGAVG